MRVVSCHVGSQRRKLNTDLLHQWHLKLYFKTSKKNYQPTDNQYSDWKKYSATFLLEDIAVTGQTLQKKYKPRLTDTALNQPPFFVHHSVFLSVTSISTKSAERFSWHYESECFGTRNKWLYFGVVPDIIITFAPISELTLQRISIKLYYHCKLCKGSMGSLIMTTYQYCSDPQKRLKLNVILSASSVNCIKTCK